MQDPQQQKDPLAEENAAVELTPEQQQEYEELKQRNRRRLVGAGAITLLVGGLFAAIAGGNASENTQQPTLTEASAPNLAQTQPEAFAPNLASAPSVASQPVDVLPINTAAPAASEPMIAEASISTPIEEVPTTTDNAAVAPTPNADGLETAPIAVQESHNRRLAEQAAQDKRANVRAEAQARLQRAEAEREAREQAIAERARQAQTSAEQKRAAERERLAQQKAEAERKREQAAQAKAATQATPAKAITAIKGNFAVQAGAFGSKAQADKVRSQVEALGYGASVTSVKTAKGTLYRVQATGFGNRGAAESAAAKMKARGLGGMIVGK
ncbi:SPOR domain-containing protein [Neisseriaceae bacterium B1]